MVLVGGLGAIAMISQRRWLRLLTTMVLELTRGSATLVVLFWAFYVLPRFGLEFPPVVVGVAVLGVIEACYAAEVFRGSLVAVPKGQWEAARTSGISGLALLRRIILPQALPLIISPLGNLTIQLLKFTSLLSFISIRDLTSRALQLRYHLGHSALIFGCLIVVYFILARAIQFAVQRIEHRFAIKGRGRELPELLLAVEGA